MKIGILGSAAVARTLAAGFVKHGHDVTMGTRDPAALADWAKQHPGVAVESVAVTAQGAEFIVLAVKGTAASVVMHAAGADNTRGKTIIDTTNPIADAPPVNGVLKYFTSHDDSLLERLQRESPEAHFVKAFNSVGNAQMVNPELAGGPPTMFICGNDDGAKAQVRAILDQFGWSTADMGKAEAARAIEPLCMLWCIPGFLQNQWTHAFKLLV